MFKKRKKSNLQPLDAVHHTGHLNLFEIIIIGLIFNGVTARESSEIREQWGWILVALCNQDMVMRKGHLC